MATVTVRPNSDIQAGSWTPTGAASHNAAWADESDATYAANTTGTSSAQVGLAAASVSATQRVKRVRLRYRTRKLVAGQNINQYLADTTDGTYRLIYQNSAPSITTFTGPWWTTNTDGSEWTAAVDDDTLAYYLDIDSAGAPTADAWRMYAVYVDYDIRDLITLSAPTVSGTATTRPTTAWTTTPNADGDPQKKYQVYVYPSAVYSAPGFVAGTTAGWTWTSGQVSSTATSRQVGVDLAFGTTYRSYVRIAQDFNGQTWWTAYQNVQYTVAVPGGSTPQPPTPTLVRTVDDPAAKVLLDVTARLNVLSAQDSSLEATGTGSWVAGASTSIARSTAQAGHLTASLQLTRNSTTGDATATTPTGASGIPVRAGMQYTGTGFSRANGTTRSSDVAIFWYKADGTASSTPSNTGTAVTNSAANFNTQLTVTATAPADAAFAALRPRNVAALATEIHYWDKLGVWPGSSTTWMLGGYVDALPPTGEVRVEYQDTLGPNFLPANVADAGESLGTTDGWHKRTAGDLLDLTSGSPLQGARCIRWGPSAAASVLDAGMLTTAPNYELAPLAAAGRSMVASAWIRTESGSVSITLGLGAHNFAGAVGSIANGSPLTVTTIWQRITSGVLSVGDTALFSYLAFDNTGDTTTLRILIDKVQLEVATAASTDWQPGTGDRPTADWAHVRSSPIAGSALPVEQQAWLHDHETRRVTGIRLYRASVSTVDLDGISVIASPYAYAAAHNAVTDGSWWLKDPLFPATAFTSTHFLDPADEGVDEDLEVVHPLGRPYPVSVSSWIGDGDSGRLSVMAITDAEWAQLYRLLHQPRALYLQSPFGWNRYIRVTGRPWTVTTLAAGLARTVEVTYHDEARPTS